MMLALQGYKNEILIITEHASLIIHNQMSSEVNDSEFVVV